MLSSPPKASRIEPSTCSHPQKPPRRRSTFGLESASSGVAKSCNRALREVALRHRGTGQSIDSDGEPGVEGLSITAVTSRVPVSDGSAVGRRHAGCAPEDVLRTYG